MIVLEANNQEKVRYWLQLQILCATQKPGCLHKSDKEVEYFDIAHCGIGKAFQEKLKCLVLEFGFFFVLQLQFSFGLMQYICFKIRRIGGIALVEKHLCLLIPWLI